MHVFSKFLSSFADICGHYACGTQSKEATMTDRIEQQIDIYPATWPARNIKIRPGDLRHFAPQGRASMSLVPGGELEAAAEQPADPFLMAPATEPVGGIIFIHDQPQPADLAALMRLLRIDVAAADYAAFLERSADPAETRCMAQLRVVRSAALVGLYGAITLDEMRYFPEQRLTMGELAPAFVAAEREAWEARPAAASSKAAGRPSLGFGVMVENTHFGVYRIFSRIWRALD